jgi:phosphatidylserine/phosphatidylglycerophosphate/cardiolipin synthase-like enzyme
LSKLLAKTAVLVLCALALFSKDLQAQTASPPTGTHLCDVAYQICRDQVLTLIQNEPAGGEIDLSFWFMTDARYASAIATASGAGVKVRIIMDPRANSKTGNSNQLATFKAAGIPMLNKPFGDIAHWKGMIFKAQKVAEFSGANYSPYEYKYTTPYVDYDDESIYFSTETDVVQSLMRRFDDVWMDTNYTFYANPVPRVRSYPTTYTIAPEFNLPPDDSYTDRLLPLLNNEMNAIDVVMFRITDPRPANALISAVGRGVPVRLYAEPDEYRNPARLDDSYNIDRMYMGGVHIKMRAHNGQNHQKTIRLVGQKTTVFGTSNWSTASDDNQLEVNYFTTKDWFYEFFRNQFEWKWNNKPLDGSGTVQTAEFLPLEPDGPSVRTPANAATGVAPGNVVLKWSGNTWGRKYDIYFGIGPNPPLVRSDIELGAGDNKTFTVSAPLPGTTYSWKIVSKTMANVAKAGGLWTFTTSGTPPANPPPPQPDTTAPVVYVYAPANNSTVSGSRDVYASGTDNVAAAVAGVQFKLDGVNLGAEDRSAPFKLTWNTTTAANGSHTLSAVARDNAGNRTTAVDIHVTVDNTGQPSDTNPPSVALTAPTANATLSGTTTVTATSSDDIGVAGVQFKVDGANLGAEVISSPYSISWTTTSFANGTHTVTATARDAAGNTASSTATVTVSNTAPPTETIVLHAADVPAGSLVGNWAKVPDTTAADGIALENANKNSAKVDPALAAPQNYVDINFDAPPNTAYHMWVRMKAAGDLASNDSVHVQFSDSVDGNGAAIYTWKTANSAEVVLAEMDGGTISGWGWADQGWNGLGDPIHFAGSTTHTLRIQQREDGPRIDQIVLSPDTYFTVPPGPQKNDNTKLPANPVVPPPASDTIKPSVAISAPANGATVSGTTSVSASSSDDVRVVGVQLKVDNVNVGAEDTSAPYTFTWNTTTTSNGAHVLTAVARDEAGNNQTSAAVNVTVSNSSTPPPATIVLHATDVPTGNIVGNWAKRTDATAADGIALVNTTTSAAKIDPALAVPQHYVDIPFNPAPNTAYHLWVRLKAAGDLASNDSIHVQFSDSVDGTGAPIYTWKTTNSAEVVLAEMDGGTISGWGWADQGWNGLGDPIYFTKQPTHTLRIQQREDGPSIDQIVLSPDTYFSTPPGPQKNDTTIVPK